MQSRATCLLASLVAATALGACSGGASSTAPLAAPQAAQQSRALVDSVRAEVRFNLSPAALQARTATRGPGFISPAARKQATLFVSDLDANEVRLYPAYTKNPTQSGTITQGIDLPINAAVDKHGTLYVANNGNSTVTEYPLGQTTPSVTLSSPRKIVSARSTPAPPPAASAKRKALPINAPRAPSASALAISWPERIPPSNSTSHRPPIASAISGSTEIEDGAPSS